MPWRISYGKVGTRDWATRKRFAEIAWKLINLSLQGNKPNRWIQLNDAAWIIHTKLNVPMGEAHELLMKDATPPAVPLVGLLMLEDEDGFKTPIEITRTKLRDGDVEFSSGGMTSDGDYISRIHVELNHLEAWLEKRKAPVVQPAGREADSATETPDPYQTGLPGRPTIAHLIDAEFQRRVRARETLTSISAEANALREWALTHHPAAPTPKPRSIENQIRSQYSRIKGQAADRTK
jgi:hypothetical protein